MAFTEDLLLSAMNERGEAIVIYDENDNFLHCNDANRKLYPHLSHLYKPGVNLREIITLAVESGQFLIPETEKATFIEERISHHWVEFHETVQQLADERWVLTRTGA